MALDAGADDLLENARFEQRLRIKRMHLALNFVDLHVHVRFLKEVSILRERFRFPQKRSGPVWH